MIYLSAEKLTVYFGERVLFSDLTFGLHKGDKIALIANNGVGKSTLFKILAGKDQPNEGTIELRANIKVGYLEQQPDFPEDHSINELIRTSNSEMLKVIKEFEKASDDQSDDFNPSTQRNFEAASNAMDKAGAWDYERKTKQILTRFNITDLDQRVSTLSGGQKKRLALSLVLLDSPEILLLDEPTNHLDIEMIEWLESYLSQSHITVFMVTHDRYFLDKVCTHIIEMEDEQIYHHKGNYVYFLEKREARQTAKNTEILKARKVFKKELEWMRGQPKARTTKAKSRIDAFYEIEKKAKSGNVKKDIKLDVMAHRIGGKILELHKVHKAYGDTIILNGFDYKFKKGERIGLVGANGIGKSTFLNIITGLEPVDSGKVKKGDTIIYGYYTQEGIQFKDNDRIIDIITKIAEVITLANGRKVTASQFLDYFNFPPKMQRTPVSKLSGGEKRRLYLLTVLIKNPNFLILDEPTNDLDILTLNKLEEFLYNYKGCLLIASHDRYFMDKMADHLFIFKGEGEIKDYYDTYSSYRESFVKEEKQVKREKIKEKKKDTDVKEKDKSKKKLSFNEKYEYEQLEKEIESLESEKKQIEGDLVTYATDAQKAWELTQRYDDVKKELEAKSNRWLELSQFHN